jgi:hypothetical protein
MTVVITTLPLWISVQLSIIAYVVITWYVYFYRGYVVRTRFRTKHRHVVEEAGEEVYYGEDYEVAYRYPLTSVAPVKLSSSVPRSAPHHQQQRRPPYPHTMLQPQQQVRRPPSMMMERDYLPNK